MCWCTALLLLLLLAPAVPGAAFEAADFGFAPELETFNEDGNRFGTI